MGKRDMTEQEQRLADVTYAAIQQATNSTARSQQQADFRLGVSNIGHCREYARRMVLQEPFSDVRDKTAAFLGTVVGAAVEAALAVDHPGWVFQADVVFKIPSGGEIAGHPDIIIPFTEATPEFPQGIIDVKTRAELDSVKRNGPSMQQRFQKVAYASAAIDAGYLNPDETIWLYNLWVDRSGIEAQPYVHSEEYHPDMVTEIDQWIEDVKYAVTHGEEASRDPSREFCWAYCEYATACRGHDTDAEGLLESPDVLAAVESYVEAGELEARAKRLKNGAKLLLRGVNGSTGTHTVRWVEVGPAAFETVRDAYMRLDVRPVGKKRARS